MHSCVYCNIWPQTMLFSLADLDMIDLQWCTGYTKKLGTTCRPSLGGGGTSIIFGCVCVCVFWVSIFEHLVSYGSLVIHSPGTILIPLSRLRGQRIARTPTNNGHISQVIAGMHKQFSTKSLSSLSRFIKPIDSKYNIYIIKQIILPLHTCCFYAPYLQGKFQLFLHCLTRCK